MSERGCETMTTTETTRHDIPESVRDLLTGAVEIGVADALDIHVLTLKHGTDWTAIAEELTDGAFTDRSSAFGQSCHALICGLADLVIGEQLRLVADGGAA